MVDDIYTNLTGVSVHLADWPLGTPGNLPAAVDTGRDLPSRNPPLEERMALTRALAEAGRRVRVEADRRQRLPCQAGWLVGGPNISEFHEILADELNVESLTTEDDLERFQRIEVVPNWRALGAKCRADLPKVKAALGEADSEQIWAEIQAGSCTIEGFEITEEDVEVKRVEKDGFAAKTITFGEGDDVIDVTLVLDMATTPDLLSKGLARDIIRRVQQKRKDLDLDVDATIELSVWLGEGNPELADDDWAHVQSETRAKSGNLEIGDGPDDVDSFTIDDATISFQIS